MIAAGGAGRVHVVGAGLAGLAAAVDLAAAGCPFSLYEASTHAGGRCRSFLDGELGVRIDNGNHLLLSGNTAALRYVEQIGAAGTFERPADAAIPFVDLATGERWAVRPSRGRVPWWVLGSRTRIPGTRAADYLDALRLWRAGPQDTVADRLDPAGTLYRRLWQPLTAAALNTAPADASARLLWRIVAETLGRGIAACRPILARDGLSESLIDPALSYLRRHGGDIRFAVRLKGFATDNGRVTALAFDGASIEVAAQDSVILAVPAAIAARLLPGLVVPDDYAPIVNAHFRYAPPPDMPPFIGLVGGTAEWVFRKREVLSVTISAADAVVDEPADELRNRLWDDVVTALALPPGPPPPTRIVKERRATFRATPAQLQRRPAGPTAWNNLHLAGDYVQTDLPGTIEGAIRSGFAAAEWVRRSRGPAPATGNSVPPPRLLPDPIEDCQRALP